MLVRDCVVSDGKDNNKRLIDHRGFVLGISHECTCIAQMHTGYGTDGARTIQWRLGGVLAGNRVQMARRKCRLVQLSVDIVHARG